MTNKGEQKSFAKKEAEVIVSTPIKNLHYLTRITAPQKGQIKDKMELRWRKFVLYESREKKLLYSGDFGRQVYHTWKMHLFLIQSISVTVYQTVNNAPSGKAFCVIKVYKSLRNPDVSTSAHHSMKHPRSVTYHVVLPQIKCCTAWKEDAKGKESQIYKPAFILRVKFSFSWENCLGLQLYTNQLVTAFLWS